MDNEKYGIELELITNKFKQKIQEVKNAFKGVENKKVNLNTNNAQIEYVKSQIKEIQYLLSRADKGFEVGDTLKLQAKLEKLNIQYKKLIANQNQLSTSSKTANINITKGLDRMTSKIRRFGLSLLSIRSIWSLVSRASSAYLAQDTELANKLQSVWAGLGALLAPIIEGIVNILAKAVKYIAIFIKALTGVDLLARASAKSMNGTAKAAKGLNKALAGFDELQNLDTDTGGGTGGNVGLGGLEDVEIDTGWADRIKEFGEWVKTNWVDVLRSLAGVLTFFKVVTPLVSTFGLKLGLIKALGIGLAVAGIIKAVGSLLNYLKEPTWKNFGGIIEGIGLSVAGVALAFGAWPIAAAGAIIAVYGLIVSNWDKIKNFFQGGIDWLVSKTDWIRENFGIVGEAIYNSFLSALKFTLNLFDNFFTTIKGVFDGVIKFIKGVFTGDWAMAWEGVKQIFYTWINYIKNLFVNAWNYILSLMQNGGKIFNGITGAIQNVFKVIVNGIIWGINKVIAIPFNKINGVLNKIKSVDIFGFKPFDGFWGWNPIQVPQIPQLAVGTNYVPEDQLAMIHKGEAVVPKKFNSKEYFGNSNDETNAKLDAVIEAIKGIEINPYTTVKDVGRASLSYINAKSRQLGESVVV